MLFICVGKLKLHWFKKSSLQLKHHNAVFLFWFNSATSCFWVPSLMNVIVPPRLNHHLNILQVLPDLLSKHEAVDVFMECEKENDVDEQTEAMLLPAFMETLAMVCSA